MNIQSPSRKKAKKVRKRQSGLDFSRKKSSSAVTGKNSRDASRAHSPALGDDTTEDIRDVKQVIHSLANVLTDSKHMVTDRSTGETVLHRAAKLGYPDVAAYALDMAKMSATVKDNAGVPPIHLAAFKGHADVVDYLIRYVLFRNIGCFMAKLIEYIIQTKAQYSNDYAPVHLCEYSCYVKKFKFNFENYYSIFNPNVAQTMFQMSISFWTKISQ